MKEKIMLVTGCSHAGGSEIDGTEDSAYNRAHSFGNVLGKILGRRCVNISIASQSNSAIARGIMEWFANNYDREQHDVMVSVGWTECTRLELPMGLDVDHESNNPAIDYFPKNTAKFLQINSGWEGFTDYEKEIMPYWHEFMVKNEKMCEIMSAKDALHVQHFLQSQGADWIFCNTMPNFKKNRYTNFYINQLDMSKYFEPFAEEGFFWFYRNQGFENPKAKYWHHDETPHRLQAERLFNFINN